jgi:hypothetical protein
LEPGLLSKEKENNQWKKPHVVAQNVGEVGKRHLHCQVWDLVLEVQITTVVPSCNFQIGITLCS